MNKNIRHVCIYLWNINIRRYGCGHEHKTLPEESAAEWFDGIFQDGADFVHHPLSMASSFFADQLADLTFVVVFNTPHT